MITSGRMLGGLALLTLALGCHSSRLKHVPPTPNAPGVDELQPDPDQEFKSGRFSPDSAQVAFHALMGGTRDVVGVMNVDGTELRELATTDSASCSVAWSPDGKFVYFTSAAGLEQVAAASGAPSHVADAAGATELDVSADGATMIWVKTGDVLQSLRRNVPGAVAVEEAHHGRYPRFDENGAVPGYVYVANEAMGQHPLERDILGAAGPSGYVTMDLGAFPSVSVLGKDHYVITSPAGIEKVTQDGMRSHLSDEKAAMNVDASLDGLHVLYVVSGKGSLFIASGF